MSSSTERPLHLVGSVPLASAAEVFETVGSIWGPRAQRIPDGETGERTNWIAFQRMILADHPKLEAIEPSPFAPFPAFGLKAGEAPPVEFGDLGYAYAAAESYGEFRRLKDDGRLPAEAKFQVSLPTPFAIVGQYLVADSHAAVEPGYRARLFHELAEILDHIPRDQLALQWDVAVEFSVIEGLRPVAFDDIHQGIVDRLIDACDQVPDGIEMGLHLCYGDSGHKHFKEPEDTGHMVSIANAVSAGAGRTIDWIHMPVPRDRSDDAYFAPLSDLALRDGCTLYLGLVHFTDGAEGTRARIAAASQRIGAFGIATECGLGRRPPETIPDLLRLHIETAGA